MSVCGSCDLYWPEEKENFGVTCNGDCDREDCADTLQSLIAELRAALDVAKSQR